MKKIMSLILTISLAVSVSTVAFAEGSATNGTSQTSTIIENVKLTPEEQLARDAYLSVHLEDMNQLIALRQQTKEAAEANNVVSTQIKEAVKSKTILNSDDISNLKDLASQRKSLVEQVKQLNQQRVSLKVQYRDAVKAKDLEKTKSIEDEILNLNNQINTIKTDYDAIKTVAAPLKDQLKEMKDANKQLKDNVKNQLEQAKAIGETINSQQQEKAQLWNTYKENIKIKDYDSAGITFKAILDKKTSILENIKQRGVILNEVLASLN